MAAEPPSPPDSTPARKAPTQRQLDEAAAALELDEIALRLRRFEDPEQVARVRAKQENAMMTAIIMTVVLVVALIAVLRWMARGGAAPERGAPRETTAPARPAEAIAPAPSPVPVSRSPVAVRPVSPAQPPPMTGLPAPIAQPAGVPSRSSYAAPVPHEVRR